MQSVENPFNNIHIYCINLDRRKDRWSLIEKEFNKLNLINGVTRFSGLETPKNWHLWCMLSHEAVMKDAILKWYHRIAIFEDDITISNIPNLFATLKKIENKKYDLFYFGATFINKRARMKRIDKNFFQIEREVYWASWILYSYKILPTILDKINQIRHDVQKWRKTWDEILWKDIQKNYICLIGNNQLIKHRWFNKSDTDKYYKWAWYAILNELGFYTLKYKFLMPIRLLLLKWAFIFKIK